MPSRPLRPYGVSLVLSVLLAIAVVGGWSLVQPQPAPSALAQADVIETPIALETFEHGFMLWRQDNGQITVAYSTIPTKTGAPCQEVYLDTFHGQSYQLPAAPTGLTTPQLGFGWLYFDDPAMARRLGYATADEVSVVAQISQVASAGGTSLQLQLSAAVAGLPNPLLVAFTDEPGLTYCFPRAVGDRTADLKTWVAIQRFDGGYMVWRQDQPDRIEVDHENTLLAPEVGCQDVFLDTWTPGEVLSYGSLADPTRILPDRGFGKVWLNNPYVQQSLGYPTEDETGGFADITYSTFHHPLRGDLLVRDMIVNLADGEQVEEKTTIPGGSAQRDDAQLTHACQDILTPPSP